MNTRRLAAVGFSPLTPDVDSDGELERAASFAGW